MHGNRGTRRHEEDQETRHDEKVDERRPDDENESERNDERHPGDSQPGDARDPPPKDAVPRGRAGEDHTTKQPQTAGELTDCHRDGKHEGRRPHEQRDDRRESPIHGLPPIAVPPHTAMTHTPRAESAICLVATRRQRPVSAWARPSFTAAARAAWSTSFWSA